MSFLDAPPFRPMNARVIQIPAGLGWDSTNFPVSLSLVPSFGWGKSYGSINKTPAEIFALKSTALSAPGATFYVDVTAGLDTNNGLTAGAAFKSISKAVTAANTAGVPSKIFVKSGTYARANNIWFNGAAGVSPTVDIAFVATNGRVNTGTYDSFAAPSLDATYTNCYSFTLANAERVVDRANLDRWGGYVEFVNVGSAAVCNVTPNSWVVAGGLIYINRADRAAVTNTNTRVYRQASANLVLTVQVNIYMAGIDADSGFDIEGANTYGCVSVLIASPLAGRGVMVFDGCTFQQPGGASATGARAVSFDSLNGLLHLNECLFIGAQTDSINVHNTYGAATPPAVLAVNCAGFNPGRAGQQSCNNFTLHEDCIGIDLAGYYDESHAGNVRNIGTSKCLLAGTLIRNDRGDRVLGVGVYLPSAVVANDSAQIWCDSIIVDMPPGTHAYVATVGATVYYRNCFPVAQRNAGGGTFSPY